ncbi:MAG: hypothetical protein AB1416_10440 [Actinomycetota bacterium]
MILKSGAGFGAVSITALTDVEIPIAGHSFPLWLGEIGVFGVAVGLLAALEARRRRALRRAAATPTSPTDSLNLATEGA